jgi:hypothetical protein
MKVLLDTNVAGLAFKYDQSISVQQNVFKMHIHPLYNYGCHKYILNLQEAQ